MPDYFRNAIYPAYKRPPPTGYRKTARRNKRAVHPPWTLCFILNVNKLLCPGPVNMAGCTVTVIGQHVIGEVTGGNLDWARRQIDALATKLGHHHRPLFVRKSRQAQATPATFVPYQRGDAGVEELGHHHVIVGSVMRPMRTG